MPVEIAIVSGSRKGESVRLDGDSIQIGDDPACDVYFNPRKDSAIGGRGALITLEESGWRIRNTGAGMLLVNQDVVEDPTPLRSGDIIRMSDMGPDLAFTLIGGPKGAAAMAADTSPSTEQAMAASHETGGENGQTEPGAGSNRRLSSVGLGMLIGIGGFLALAIVALFTMPPANDSLELNETPNRSAKEGEVLDTTVEDGNEAATTSPAPKQTLDDDGPQARIAETHSPVKVDPVDPWSAVIERVVPAVYLVLAEEPKTHTAFPCGTACAIRNDALLTSAALAVELDKKRRSGWRILVKRPERDERFPVQEILVHQGFVGTADTPSDVKIYYDLAVLLVDGELGSLAMLAGPRDLDGLEPGCELGCVGISHDGEPLTRFDNPTAELTRGKLFQRSSLAASDDTNRAAAPVLLHLNATLPDNIYGSPIVNRAGSIVGIYAERAQLPDAEANERLQIHFAPVVTLAHAWSKELGSEHWITLK